MDKLVSANNKHTVKSLKNSPNTIDSTYRANNMPKDSSKDFP